MSQYLHKRSPYSFTDSNLLLCSYVSQRQHPSYLEGTRPTSVRAAQTMISSRLLWMEANLDVASMKRPAGGRMGSCPRKLLL